MKVAIYIEQGTTQLVLTPETAWEKNVVDGIQNGAANVRIMRGSFYETRGGWMRRGDFYVDAGRYGDDDKSLILRVDREAETPKEAL